MRTLTTPRDAVEEARKVWATAPPDLWRITENMTGSPTIPVGAHPAGGTVALWADGDVVHEGTAGTPVILCNMRSLDTAIREAVQVCIDTAAERWVEPGPVEPVTLAVLTTANCRHTLKLSRVGPLYRVQRFIQRKDDEGSFYYVPVRGAFRKETAVFEHADMDIAVAYLDKEATDIYEGHGKVCQLLYQHDACPSLTVFGRKVRERGDRVPTADRCHV